MAESTTLHIDDSDFVSEEWPEAIRSTNVDSVVNKSQNRHPVRRFNRHRIYLQWTPDQEVVCLPPRSLYTLAGKRIIDLLLAGFVSIFVLSWMIPLVGALILCESPGPIFFIQSRSGRRGKPFPCLKFRTMRHAATPGTGFRQTSRNDDRVTAIGRFLRRTNLDEMPQFINVLTGDMTVVGPRPHALPHDAQHWASAAYRERYWVRPGITGLAQIRGARGEITEPQKMEHRVRYDHFYIARQNFLLDMKICLWTLKLTLKGDSNAW